MAVRSAKLDPSADIDRLVNMLAMAGCGEEETEKILVGHESGVLRCEKGTVRFRWVNGELLITVEVAEE